MKTRIKIGDKEESFVKLSEAIDFLKQEIAQWNNFADTKVPLQISVTKDEAIPNSLNAFTGDVIKTADLFGRK